MMLHLKTDTTDRLSNSFQLIFCNLTNYLMDWCPKLCQSKLTFLLTGNNFIHLPPNISWSATKHFSAFLKSLAVFLVVFVRCWTSVSMETPKSAQHRSSSGSRPSLTAEQSNPLCCVSLIQAGDAFKVTDSCIHTLNLKKVISVHFKSCIEMKTHQDASIVLSSWHWSPLNRNRTEWWGARRWHPHSWIWLAVWFMFWDPTGGRGVVVVRVRVCTQWSLVTNLWCSAEDWWCRKWVTGF